MSRPRRRPLAAAVPDARAVVARTDAGAAHRPRGRGATPRDRWGDAGTHGPRAGGSTRRRHDRAADGAVAGGPALERRLEPHAPVRARPAPRGGPPAYCGDLSSGRRPREQSAVLRSPSRPGDPRPLPVAASRSPGSTRRRCVSRSALSGPRLSGTARRRPLSAHRGPSPLPRRHRARSRRGQRHRLSPSEQELLAAASVVGAVFGAPLVAAALAWPVTDVEDVCAGLAERQQFVRPSGDVVHWPDGTALENYAFLHAVYQALWQERVRVSTRRVWHQRIAERLERAYGDQAGDRSEEHTS